MVMIWILHRLGVREEIFGWLRRAGDSQELLEDVEEKRNESANFLLQIIRVRGELNQSVITLMKFSYKMQDAWYNLSKLITLLLKGSCMTNYLFCLFIHSLSDLFLPWCNIRSRNSLFMVLSRLIYIDPRLIDELFTQDSTQYF